MRGLRQPDVPAEFGNSRGDTEIVGRDNHARHGGSCAGPAVHMFDHRLAIDVREWLAGETRRGESSGDDGDDLQRIRRIDRRNSR
jgi:hypothetical protein